MTRTATAVLTAIALAGATPALAGNAPPRAHAPPSSFAPQPSSGPHVYGAPLGPPAVGGASAAQHKHASPKHPAKAAARHAHDAKPKIRQPAVYAQPDPS